MSSARCGAGGRIGRSPSTGADGSSRRFWAADARSRLLLPKRQHRLRRDPDRRRGTPEAVPMTDLFAAAGLDEGAPQPLADRLRPKTLSEVVGQEHLVGPDGLLTRLIASGSLGSLIFWGPPGTGKTTVARLLAGETKLDFEQVSAIFTGVADPKKKIETARARRSL